MAHSGVAKTVLTGCVVTLTVTLGACQPRQYRMVAYQPIDRGFDYDETCDDRYAFRPPPHRSAAARRTYRRSARRYGLLPFRANANLNINVDADCACDLIGEMRAYAPRYPGPRYSHW